MLRSQDIPISGGPFAAPEAVGPEAAGRRPEGVQGAADHRLADPPEPNPDGTLAREYDDTPHDFGRTAATTAKQVILQRLRDAEDEVRYGEFSGGGRTGPAGCPVPGRRGERDGRGGPQEPLTRTARKLGGGPTRVRRSMVGSASPVAHRPRLRPTGRRTGRGEGVGLAQRHSALRGGTPQVAGSHRVISRHLDQTDERDFSTIRDQVLRSDPWFRRLTTEATSPADDRTARLMEEADLDGIPVRVVELTGSAGDVFLTHPWVLHSIASNASDTPRMMRSRVLWKTGWSRPTD